MNRFNHFIFALLIAGSLMAMLIVSTFSRRSADRREIELIRERRQVKDAVAHIKDSYSHADMVVEWQRVSGDKQKILETAILWCPYSLTAGDEHPLPFQHITIPGDKATIDAVALTFQTNFAQEDDFLQGTTFSLFNNLLGEDQKHTAHPRLTPVGPVPLTLRADPERNILYENQLWHRIWDIYKDQTQHRIDPQGLVIKDIPPISFTLHPNSLYDVWIGKDLHINILEHNDPDAVAQLLHKATPQPPPPLTP